MSTLVIVLGIVVVLIVVIYFLMRDSGTSLSKMQSASTSSTVAAGSLPTSSSPNFTYSMWFFVSEWTTGNRKTILKRSATSSDGTENNVCPEIYLGETENDVSVRISCENGDHTCRVSNVPLQKWVNLIVSVYGRSLDVYVDGKLVRTCVLPGVPRSSAVREADIQITPSPGFIGETSQFVYWADATNPTEAAAIYRKGYGGSLLGNLFNKYRLQFTFIKDGRDVSSFQI